MVVSGRVVRKQRAGVGDDRGEANTGRRRKRVVAERLALTRTPHLPRTKSILD